MSKSRHKCPICNKPYNDYMKHIWTHKKKTVEYLQKARKNAPKKTKSAKYPRLSKGKFCSQCGKPC